ncbi:multiple organellar RNA editing factor 2, chloroplastic [Lactuca sativa]|uniref:multiple organellar RNA editing factor 2, chloroplastic n=1 Tax=Lactuca sativa TaxID=4236 RepID=UPI001C687A06|nr:multiple organellar RNA editing factor 2, chloroplastic [Lactuca sativa]
MFRSNNTIRSIQSLSDLDDERLYLVDHRYMWIGLSFSDRPQAEMAPLFPGCDYEHIIVMDKPDGEGTTNQQMIDCYVETESKFLRRYIIIP